MGGVDEDAGQNEGHRAQRHEMSNVLVRAVGDVGGVLVSDRDQADGGVGDEGGHHQDQPDAAQRRQPSDLPQLRPRRFYH